MTNHPTHDYDDQAVSNRLGRHQHTLDDSLDGVLDIEAGLREILIYSRHDTAVNALGTVLNTEAGLAGILPPTPQPQASGTPGTQGRRPRAGDFLLQLSPADRMALRDHPPVKATQLLLIRAHDLDLVLALARARAHDLALALDHDSYFTRARALDLARALARALADALDLALDLADDSSRASSRASDLALNLSLARARARDRARDLKLNTNLARASDLARDLSINLTHDLARDLTHDLAHDFTRARALAHDLDLILAGALRPGAFIEIRTNEVCRAIGLALHREPPALDAASVLTLLNDFTHDDLRDTDLRGIDFSGVHWSQHTQWPPDVDIEALKARSDETPPGSGIWIVRSGTTTARDTADLT